MFWYISFLRPPPVGTVVGDGVVITPQVANDLRTDTHPTNTTDVWLRQVPTPISYVWNRVGSSKMTPATELTVFEPPMSTYRPITVPLPKLARAGEKWRLGLFSPPHSLESPLLALSGGEDEVPVMGVWSEGIELRHAEAPSGSGPIRGVGAERANGKGKKDGKGKEKEKKGKAKEEKDKGKKDEPKQTRITRAWPLGDGGGELKLVEQTSFDLDKKVWDSGLALASWLQRWHTEQHQHAMAATVLARLKGARTLELGSGTGLVGIALALLDDGVEVVATDLDSALEIMDENIALNGVQGRVSARILDWDAPLPSWAPRPVIIAADVTYNTASFPALVGTLERLLKPEEVEGESPLLLLAYKQRDAAERDLWAMLADRGIGTVLVDTVPGAEDYGVTEIWVAGVGVE